MGVAAISSLVLVGLAAVGLGLVIAGLRGRQRREGPACARCGYPVTGGAAPICSECGASLATPRSVRRGSRSPRPVMLLAGWGMILVAAGSYPWGSGGPRGCVMTTRPLQALATADLLASMRGWEDWLDDPRVQELDSRFCGGQMSAAEADAYAAAILGVEVGPTEARPAAWAEAVARLLTAGILDQPDRDRVLDHLLAVQQDPGRRWDGAWGDAIESEFAAGRLSDETMRRYLRQFASPRLVLDDVQPWRGQTVGLRLDPGWRAGKPSRLTVRVRLTLPDEPLARLDPESDRVMSPWTSPGWFGSVRANFAADAVGEFTVGDEPGPRTLRAVVEYDLMEPLAAESAGASQPVPAQLNPDQSSPDQSSPAQSSPPQSSPAHATPTRVWGDADHAETIRVTVDTPYEITPRAAPETALVPDESLRPAILASLNNSHPLRVYRTDAGDIAAGALEFAQPPAHLAFDVFWRAEGVEHRVGWLLFTRDHCACAEWYRAPVEGFGADSAEVVLRASRGHLRRHRVITELWGGEIVLPAAPVERIDGEPPRPASGEGG